MIISGIVVMVPVERLAEVCASIDALPWAEVHFSDARGRVVATIEAEGVEESMERLQQLQGLRHVFMAELAQYYLEDEPRGEAERGHGTDTA